MGLNKLNLGITGTLIATDDLPLHASAHHGARPTLTWEFHGEFQIETWTPFSALLTSMVAATSR
jgi:hypothetical protein